MKESPLPLRVLAGVLALAFLLSPASLFAQADEAPAKTTLKVLYIGNSYTQFHWVPWHAETVAHGMGLDIEWTMATRAGSSLKWNWENGTGREELAKGGWDYVVLQEQSTGPIRSLAESFRYGWMWIEAIREAGAEPILYQTWSRGDLPEMVELATPDLELEVFQKRMQRELDKFYLNLAKEAKCRVATVGAAFALGRERLPENVHLNWPDNSHASFEGAYLAGLSVFCALFEVEPVDVPRVMAATDPDNGTEYWPEPVVIDPEVGKILEQCAWEAFYETRRTLRGH